MAKGRERFEKRQREQQKQEKAAEKRARRAERAQDKDEESEGPTEDELLEQVRLLNEAHAEERISTEEFEDKRAELFEALGIE